MPKHDQDSLFELWLDNKLSIEQAQQLEQLASQDEALAARLASARFIEQQALAFEPEPVPKWDKQSTFSDEKRPWWQWRAMPALSMAMSIVAIALVLFKVEISNTEQGLLVSFGGSQAMPTDVEQLVNARLIEFAKEQQVVMAEFNQDIISRQQDNNLKLATYVLSASRTERQQDISNIVSFVNEAREEDNLQQSLKMQQLDYKLQAQTIGYRIDGQSDAKPDTSNKQP
ncbi:hypothetical protein E2K93_03310 [Thalassotalea sp. HSM 43]|uniref:hypothetical protein n=1 Tax=Thalassotalea sp. HSM 43 TaxID=2552945 RepID=UPI00108019EE|nr:hypothetical protein [Thalassotalea sp. HSM 43]QBY03461.1 hypothetical protein E2K93_03310 [Thalassotalea sp. HSM 43]